MLTEIYKYGPRNALLYAERDMVTHAFNLIRQGELEKIDDLTKKMPAGYLMKMRSIMGYSALDEAI